jgi:hypothetical protein
MAPPLAAVGFSRVLDHLQVVRYRNDREQDEQKDCQGDKLHSPVAAGTRGKAQPKAEHEGCKQNPGEIEDQLHLQN